MQLKSSNMSEWHCRCGQVVFSPSGKQYHDNGRPTSIKWSDDHECYFRLAQTLTVFTKEPSDDDANEGK